MAASYPLSVYTPAAKSNGQVIQAAWFNDPDSEITAVENALLNGLAHPLVISTGGVTISTGGIRIAGHSSLVGNLQQTGNSTITGSLSVSGNSTFDANVTVTGTLTLANNLSFATPSVSVKLSADSQVAAATNLSPNWDVEEWNVGGMHSTSANSSRLTFADSTGLYAVGVCFEYNNPAGGAYKVARIRFNDTSAVVGVIEVGDSPSTAGITVSGVVRATSTTDYITAIFFNSGSTSRVFANSTLLGSKFWAYKISK